VDLLCLFPDTASAVAAVPRIMTEGGVIPTAIEYMDKDSVQAACEYLNESLPYQDCGAMLLITVDGPDEGQVLREYESIGELCLAAGAQEVYVADNHTTSERIWKIRRNIAEAYALISPLSANEDLVVPPAAIPELILGMGELARKYGIFVPAYGHAGDGNIHTRITKNPAWTVEKWKQEVPNILGDLYDLTARLGGRLSGEHGIGHKRKKYMTRFVTNEYLDLCRAIKRAWDPNNVLNPGKIFDV
jgi:glycolate oxidase